MALTLLGAALALLGMGDRVIPLHRLERLRPHASQATATLLLPVGLGLAIRSLPGLG